ncbi:LCP family protein [Bacillus sp. FJAT-45037]|uniref:LCP family protein n=1 Tax=Bacillus sp. FJAT-45037 TaxID=2011007 RepID=UPI000C2323E9|nr:LCP family protein [Bacillus sp. FJAT-45037]
MTEFRLNRKQKKKKSTIQKMMRAFFITSILLIIVSAGAIGYFALKVNNAASNSYQELDRNTVSDLRDSEVTLSKDPTSILLMGVEDYEGGRGRTDALILLVINPGEEKAAMLSIPRDSKTHIPYINREDKINHAYSYGYEDATVGAVQEMFDIPIDYFVSTNFDGFEEVIDELGGITVDVPFSFTQTDMDLNKISFEEGEMTLDGRESLAFVRMRKQDPRGDFGRNERQQIVIQSIIDKTLSISSINRLDNLVDVVGDNTKTNIRLREVMSSTGLYKYLTDRSLETLQLEGTDERRNGVYYFIPSEESLLKTQSKLKTILELEPSTEETSD